MTRHAALYDYQAVAEKLKEMRRLNFEMSDLMFEKFPKSLYDSFGIDKKLNSARSQLEDRLMKEQPIGYASLSVDEIFDIFYGGV